MEEELSTRQKKILLVVVKDYIDKAEPVGSNAVLQKCFDLDCSSATIRNELSLLEEKGFLTHPYTSAGRIPTDQGYRFYVDKLMKAYKLTSQEKTLVEELHKSLNQDMSSILNETMRTIKSIAGDNATIIKTNNKLLTELTSKIHGAMDQTKKEAVYVSGLAKMFYQPEFNNIENVRKLMNLVDHQEKFVKILDDYSDPEKISINIGQEMASDELEDYSLVTKDFHYKGESLGSLSILGPTRMKYAKVTEAINTIANVLDDIFDHL